VDNSPYQNRDDDSDNDSFMKRQKERIRREFGYDEWFGEQMNIHKN